MDQPVSPRSAPRSAFAFPEFRLFFAARMINAFGTNIMVPAAGWQVYELTHSPLSLGLIGLWTFIPVALASLPAGQAADRLERRMVYRAAQLALTLTALSFVTMTLAHVRSPLWLYCGTALFGAGKTFSMPTANSWMPHLIERDVFPSAVALTSLTYQIASVAGPALAGMLLWLAGPAVTYAVAAACYFGSLLLATLIRTRSKGRDSGQKVLTHLFSGFTHIWRHKLILGAITLDLFALLLGGATAMMPVFAFDILHVGETGFGLLRGAPALGSMIMALLLSTRPLSRRIGPWMFASTSFYGVLIVAFALSRHFILSLAILAALGAVETIGAFLRQTLVQMSTHDDMRGRVTSVNMMFGSARAELGEMETGLVAAVVGTVPAVILGGVGTLVIALVWVSLFPALRRVDRFGDVLPEAALQIK